MKMKHFSFFLLTDERHAEASLQVKYVEVRILYLSCHLQFVLARGFFCEVFIFLCLYKCSD